MHFYGTASSCWHLTPYNFYQGAGKVRAKLPTTSQKAQNKNWLSTVLHDRFTLFFLAAYACAWSPSTCICFDKLGSGVFLLGHGDRLFGQLHNACIRVCFRMNYHMLAWSSECINLIPYVQHAPKLLPARQRYYFMFFFVFFNPWHQSGRNARRVKDDWQEDQSWLEHLLDPERLKDWLLNQLFEGVQYLMDYIYEDILQRQPRSSDRTVVQIGDSTVHIHQD